MEVSTAADVFERTGRDDISVLLLPSEEAMEHRTALVTEAATERGAFVLYISIARPAPVLRTEFGKAGVKPGSVFFIDCASPLPGTGPKRVEDAILIHPAELTNIAIAINTVLDAIPSGQEVVTIIDGLDTLSLYNEESVVLRFARSLFGKIHGSRSRTVILALSDTGSSDFMDQLALYVDNRIQVQD